MSRSMSGLATLVRRTLLTYRALEAWLYLT
jgi:hypothetical protein